MFELRQILAYQGKIVLTVSKAVIKMNIVYSWETGTIDILIRHKNYHNQLFLRNSLKVEEN